MNIPEELKYTNDHEWVRLEGDVITVGITDFATKELGDVVYVEVGELKFEQTDVCGSIEAVKTVSDMLMPIEGTITTINEELEDRPELINSDCYGEGWILKADSINRAQYDELLTAAQYAELIG